MLRALLSASLALCLFAFSSSSFGQEAPDKMIQRITNEVMAEVRDNPAVKSGDQEAIRKVVDEKILPHVDFERATALAMGHYWRNATPQQKQQLQQQFQALLMHTYAGALAQVRDQKIAYDPLRAEPGADNVVVHAHTVNTQGEPIQFGYRLIRTPDGWKVYDVNVLGVWMGEAYRQSFYDEIQRSGIDGLIHVLQEKNKSLAAHPPKNGQGNFGPQVPTPQ